MILNKLYKIYKKHQWEIAVVFVEMVVLNKQLWIKKHRIKINRKSSKYRMDLSKNKKFLLNPNIKNLKVSQMTSKAIKLMNHKSIFNCFIWIDKIKNRMNNQLNNNSNRYPLQCQQQVPNNNSKRLSMSQLLSKLVYSCFSFIFHSLSGAVYTGEWKNK